MRAKDKVTIITGGSRGIGSATAQRGEGVILSTLSMVTPRPCLPCVQICRQMPDLFLASDEASYIAGVVLSVDGMALT